MDLPQVRGELRSWLISHEWQGIDPFDGLNSPFVAPWVQGPLRNGAIARFMRLAVLQAVKRSPVNLRPLLKVEPQENAMTRAVAAMAAFEANDSALANACLLKVMELADPESHLWGYPFAWQARAFYLPKNSPNLVISAFCLRALLEGFEKSSEQPLREQLRSHIRHALDSLNRFFFKIESGFFSYVSHDEVLVHNANLLGAEVLLRGIRLGITTHELTGIALAALEASLSAQAPSGRWSYGTTDHHQWADNFHTAYNLVSLARIHEDLVVLGESVTTQGMVADSIRRGWSYYLAHGFDESGTARYYDNQKWPLEGHSYAAALVCIGELGRTGWIPLEVLLPLGEKVYGALVRDLYLGNGRFAYRRWRNSRVTSVFTRWTQAWLFYGLESWNRIRNPAE